MPTEDWRSPGTVERLKRLERPGFAVEFPRRNPEYRRDFARVERLIARHGIDEGAARAGLARRWGLQFRS